MEAAALARGRRAFWLTVGALVWGAGLVVAAFLVPVYGGSETAPTPSGLQHTSFSQTLVAVNGLRVLLVVGAPAVIAALVWLALHARCSRGSTRSGVLAWGLIAILVAGCLVALASVGVFMAPAAALLVRAAAITPRGGDAARAAL